MKGLRSLTGLTDALSGPRTTSRAVFLIVVGMILFRVVVTESMWGHPPQDWALRLGLCIALSALLMWLSFLTWQRWLAGRRSKIIATMVLFFVISLITVPSRAITSDEVAQAPLALLSRSLLTFASLVLVTFLLNESDRYRQAVNEFFSERVRLEELRIRTDIALAKVRKSLDELVESTVGPALRRCSAQLRELVRGGAPGDALTSAANQIREAGLDVVRELSHSLDSEPPKAIDLEPTGQVVARPKTPGRLRGLLEEASSAKPFRPVAISVVVLLGAASVSVPARGLAAGIAVAAAVSCVGFVGLWIAARFVAHPIRKLSLIPRLAVVLITLAAIATLVFVCISPVINLGIRGWPGFIVAYVGMSAVLAIGSALFELRRRHLVQLAETLAAISLEDARLRNSELRVRRKVAQFLHGETQSRLAAIAMQLDVLAQQVDVPRDDPGVLVQLSISADALDDTRDKLKSLAETVDADGTLSVREGLQVLVDRWRNVCAVVVECDEPLARRINEAPAVTTAVVECAKEAVSNAVRHGKARNVVVTLQIVADHVEVRVTNDGVAVRADYVPGLGMQTLLRAGAQIQLGTAEPATGMVTEVRVRLAIPA